MSIVDEFSQSCWGEMHLEFLHVLHLNAHFPLMFDISFRNQFYFLKSNLTFCCWFFFNEQCCETKLN